MAHKQAGSSTQLGRDSRPKYLGVKIFGGSRVKAGQIIVRQRGTRYMPGSNVRVGGDDTIYAEKDGTVKFRSKMVKRFTGTLQRKTLVDVT